MIQCRLKGEHATLWSWFSSTVGSGIELNSSTEVHISIIRFCFTIAMRRKIKRHLSSTLSCFPTLPLNCSTNNESLHTLRYNFVMDRLLPPDLSNRMSGLLPFSLGFWLYASPPSTRTIVTTILALNTRELTTSAWLPFLISVSEIIWMYPWYPWMSLIVIIVRRLFSFWKM